MLKITVIVIFNRIREILNPRGWRRIQEWKTTPRTVGPLTFVTVYRAERHAITDRDRLDKLVLTYWSGFNRRALGGIRAK